MDYGMLVAQVRAFAEEEPHPVPLMSNVSALLFQEMADLNWAGFYLVKRVPASDDATDGTEPAAELVVGPFQGKPACIRIAYGKGVCGTAWAGGEVQRVPDVHEFPGHIACDSASNSEIVLPVRHEGEVVAVLDIDSPLFDRFSEEDEAGLREVVGAIENYGDLSFLPF